MRTLLPLFTFAGLLPAQYYIASTIAGNGQLPPPASGSIALNTRLVSPRNVASNDPPAEPGAFVREPLKAAGWGRWRGPVV